MDQYLRIETISAIPIPQQVAYLAMHQCYSEDPVIDGDRPTEAAAGEIAIKRLLAGDRGHWGPLEHPQIVLNVIGFPHSTMQQIRTHRVGVSFDVSSFRYTGRRIIDVAEERRPVDEVFYLRPVGDYRDRKGKKYHYGTDWRYADQLYCLSAAKRYAEAIAMGMAEEHARGCIPFDVRQHFVMSCNLRAAFHLLDLRWKKDAQLEAQWFAELLFQRIQEWSPAIAEWYQQHRAGKAKLSP